ncbi:Pyruvate dehydrogenase E1 component [Geodia barretti]|uniref:Pyruvate dehydrogenase E1 component n=1 Tax=Geodia barretti TaxID=519541 RepID=A0AA35WUL5_GEOBA|nr:Pyruvate dehydrogenase E1 component [Geodia barretti]
MNNNLEFAVRNEDIEALETQEWLESLDDVLKSGGPARVKSLLQQLQMHAQQAGVSLPYSATTPFLNTVSVEDQAPFPGSREIERRIKSLVRWNAMAMVVRANRLDPDIGGHISTFASAATLYEVAFNHFIRGNGGGQRGDQVYFQGHASPGIYARAFLEGRLSQEQLENFRNELKPGGGLASYPHPWLMPDFWEFPTVSMGLGPIMGIYQARFNCYLEDRGLLQPDPRAKVWVFLGDGETDEPEALGSISLAYRAKLNNLIFVVNCNLQRLDGPVRGNGKIIQELEAVFRGAGWTVIKVVWGSGWDPVFARDYDGRLAKRLGEIVDGEYQKFSVSDGAYIREHICNGDPHLLDLLSHLSDEQLRRMRRGGHDPEKVYAAYKVAMENDEAPTVILAQTIKGYGLGEGGEGRNITHKQKLLNEDELREFRARFGIPISDDTLPERRSIARRRQESAPRLRTPPESLFEELYHGTGNRAISTTMAFVRLLSKLLRERDIGKLIVPIVPDEARTFGMESLFRQCGIYSHIGQRYEPVDADSLLYYKESTDGQLLEEGITEAGSMASFIAAGTAYATHGINTIPFFIYYSIHLLAYPIPNLLAYDPAFAYEVAVIIRDGIRRMYEEQENVFYYLTVENQNYPMPPMPDDPAIKEGILKGMYRFKTAENPTAPLKAQLMGSGAIMNEVLEAQQLLAERYHVAADVWSVTSYKALRREGLEVVRWNMLHPDETPRQSHLSKCVADAPGVFVAASDYTKTLPDSVARWFPRPLTALGTDGFGRSDGRKALRHFFEVDARFIAYATLHALALDGQLSVEALQQAQQDLEIDAEKINPMMA